MHGTPGTLPGRVHSPEDGSFLVQFACPHCEAPCRQVTLQLLPRQLRSAGLWRAAACRRHAETMRMHSAACVPRCWLLGSESFSACASLLGWSRGPGPWAQAMWVSRDARGHHQSDSKPPTVLCGIGHWNCWLGLGEVVFARWALVAHRAPIAAFSPEWAGVYAVRCGRGRQRAQRAAHVAGGRSSRWFAASLWMGRRVLAED